VEQRGGNGQRVLFQISQDKSNGYGVGNVRLTGQSFVFTVRLVGKIERLPDNGQISRWIIRPYFG
jgi:hypothetical protein